MGRLHRRRTIPGNARRRPGYAQQGRPGARARRGGGSGSAGIDPAAAQAITAQEQASLTGDITFSVASGTFQGTLSVGLSTAIAGAEIRYTTSGAAPTVDSQLYTAPVPFTTTTQLRAQSFVAGAASGAMGTALYIARSITATHDLPLVVMDAHGGGKPGRTDYQDVATTVMAPQNSSTSLSQTPTIATRVGFHLRGQSSSNFEKAPYRIELRGNDDKDADYPGSGMPADSGWALLGPYPAKTLWLTEPEISGGYILQVNVLASEPPTLVCTPEPPQNICRSDLQTVLAHRAAWLDSTSGWGVGLGRPGCALARHRRSVESAEPADVYDDHSGRGTVGAGWRWARRPSMSGRPQWGTDSDFGYSRWRRPSARCSSAGRWPS